MSRTRGRLTVVALARPLEEVIIEVVFAEGGVAHVDDGLGSSATINAKCVVAIRPLN